MLTPSPTMRRSEFKVTSQNEIHSFINSQKTGVLSLIDPERHPFALPMSYFWYHNSICFHSSPHGRKADIIGSGCEAQFTIYKEYSYIPSYFTDSGRACSATVFFKSVLVNGRLFPVTDLIIKADIFNAMMNSFQPEGKFPPLSADGPFAKMLEAAAVYRLDPDETSAKFKFGQNLDHGMRQSIIERLEKRGTPLDIETAGEIKRFTPEK